MESMDTEFIEKEYADLKEAFEAGEIEVEAFQTAVDALHIQDDYGRYWTIGVESGQWYYFDGVSWIQADPREADSLPFIDENGVYWMLGQESGEWYYYDGENWVHPEINGVDLDAYATAAEEYYQDSEGRFWAIGKKSGEWYYYDEGGWHRARELPTGVPSGQPTPQQPYYSEQAQPASSPQSPNTVPFQPVQPSPSYLQGYSSTGYKATQAVRPQSTYPPASSPAGPVGPQPQQPSTPQSVDPYGYTQPVPPQGQPQQPAGQPTGYSQPTSPEAPSPQVPAGKPEPGVWFYYDGEQWLRYQEDPEAQAREAEAEAYTGLEEEEAYFADEEYFDEVDELYYEEDQVVEIEDLDEFVEVVEVQEEDIIDLEEDEALVDAEFQVEVLRPGEKASSQTTPLETVSTSASASEAAAAVEIPAAAPKAAQTAKPQPQTSGLPKVSPQPQRGKAEFSARAVPAWFWTSMGGVIILIATAVLLISIRYALNDRQETVSMAAVTPTLSAGVPPTTPTVGPTPPPTATILPTATPVPLNTYDSDYFGFSIEYPSGWVYRENDDLVIFAPSTRSLDNTNLNGATLWISFTEDANLTSLLAGELERFSPISETLNEGSMEIGSQSWASAQIRFNSTELGGEAIALIASTVRDDVGYSLVAVAPATEWEDFVTLFQYPVNSFAFLKGEGQALAEAPTPAPQAKEETGAGEGSAGDDVERPTPQPTSTGTATATSETVPPTPTIYTVLSGDTLGGISLKFDVAIDDLVEANNLESDEVVLQIGQQLIIPQAGVAIAAVTATATSASTSERSTATPEEEGRSAGQSPAEADEPTATPTEAAPTATSVPTTPPPPTPEPVKEVILSGRIVYPAYSTDINSFNVWTTGVDGSNSQIIAGNASQPQFSPNGSLFAYRSWEPSNRGIYFVDFTTGRQELLTHFIEDGLPTWSPDGTLVFSSRREGDRLPRLYRVGQRPETDFSLGFIAEYPDTLPDGHLVARGCTMSGECGLWKLLPDGSGEVKISSDTSDTAPAPNPLGGRIALMSFDRGGAGNWEIWTISPDGSDPRRLTENRANDGLPAWSPDGRSIAFVSDRGGVWAIWVMNSDGSNQRKLFDMPSPPDGQVLHDVPNSRGWLEERIDWIP